MLDGTINADRYTDAELERATSLLLHACCAPCACGVLPRLAAIRPTLYFFNPNIDTRAEFDKRLNEVNRLAKEYGLPLIVEPYDHGEFLTAACGLEEAREGGARCEKCIALRIIRTAERAKADGFSHFCTTLSVSPHKSAPLINALGDRAAKNSGVTWLPSDFKKRNGFFESVKRSKEAGMYRQSYCGCEFAKERV